QPRIVMLLNWHGLDELDHLQPGQALRTGSERARWVLLAFEVKPIDSKGKRDVDVQAAEDAVGGASNGILVESQLEIDGQAGAVVEGVAHDVEAADVVRAVDLDRTDLLLAASLQVALDFGRADVVGQRDQVNAPRPIVI